jgi:hypothetical protein
MTRIEANAHLQAYCLGLIDMDGKEVDRCLFITGDLEWRL